jgi:hypothetical protein
MSAGFRTLIASTALVLSGCGGGSGVEQAPRPSGLAQLARDYELTSVNGNPLPADVMASSVIRQGDTTIYVRSGSVRFVRPDTLQLNVYMVTSVCEAPSGNTCLLSGTGGPIAMRLGFEPRNGSILVHWPRPTPTRPDRRDELPGHIVGDTLRLVMPFRKVYGGTRPDSMWVAHFIFLAR